MKVYKKEKFYYLKFLGGPKKGPVEGDFYYTFENRFIKKFPYFTRKLITYKFTNNLWVEQKEKGD